MIDEKASVVTMVNKVRLVQTVETERLACEAMLDSQVSLIIVQKVFVPLKKKHFFNYRS